MTSTLARPPSFPELFALAPCGDSAYTIRLRGWDGRSFGGQTLGCAIHAAAKSCEGRALHSLHASFLRMAPPDTPLEVRVHRVSEGRRLARRRVEVRLDERLLFEGVASFTSPTEGAEFPSEPIPKPPPPDGLPSDEEMAREEGWSELDPIDFRWIDLPWRIDGPAESSRYRTWVRPRLPLPSPALRFAALAYLSDFHSHFPAARKLGGGFDAGGFVSLDQVLWLHRDLDWTDWWLLTSELDVAHQGRALTRRTLHTGDGLLVATMAQEALIPSPEGAPSE